MPRILIADDEWLTRLEIEEMLTDLGYDVVGQAETGVEAVDMVRDLEPDLVIMDVIMPGEMNGIDAAKVIKAEWKTPIVFLTGYGEPEYIEAVKEIAPFGYIMKPFDEKEIHASVEIALYKRELELKLEKTNEELERRVESRTAELEKANKQLKEENEARKRTEEALRESEEHFRSFMESAKGFIVYRLEVDPENYFSGHLIFVSPSIEDEIGVSPEAKFSEWFNNVHPEDLPGLIEAQAKSVQNGDTFDREFRWKNQTGEWGWCHAISNPVFDSEGKPKYYNGMVIIITAQKQALQALRENERHLESLIASAYNFTVYRLVSDGANPNMLRVIFVSPSITDIMGVSEPMNFETWFEHIHPDDVERIVKANIEALETLRFDETMRIHHPQKQEWIWIHAVSTGFEDKEHQCMYVNGILTDVTREKAAEKALVESEEKYRNLVEESFDGIFVQKGQSIIFVNKRLNEMLGYEEGELIGQKPWVVYHSDFQKLTRERAKIRMRGEAVEPRYEVKLQRKDGSWFYGEINARAITFPSSEESGIQVWIKDIDERKHGEEEKRRLETQLQQSQKMEAVGTLAGGIAHDFNNILAVILGNTELLSFDIPDSDPAAKPLKAVHQASIRAKDMVQQLLAFSRKSDAKSRPFNMTPIIKESMKMLRSAVPTSVEFKQHLSGDLCNVLGDATQIHQVVMNLVTNAAHAMSEEGGLLELTLDHITLQEEKSCFDWVLFPGKYVRLKVRDTGEGIAPTIINRIFEPYYTTKEVGKGTGMGLSVVHGIVKRHGGGIRVESELGKGTIFEIYFPALEKTAVEEKEPEGEIKGGPESILFVDDEESMVELNRQRLERLGYQVKSTTNPVEALEWFKANPDQFDVIITDMTMPRMTGDRLAAEVLAIRPEMSVIICTGYSERMSAKKAEALGVSKYIEKPIDLRNLASSLREVLDE